MEKFSARLNWIFKNQECYIFLGLWLWLGIFNILEEKDHQWFFYLRSIALLAITQLPGILFAIYKPVFREKWSREKYLLYWIGCFLMLLPLVTFCAALTVSNNNDAMMLATGGLCAFFLELILTANYFYQRKVQHYKWIKKLGLENSILISLILIALTLSAMAASSLHHPDYNKNGQLLIGFEFSLLKIIQNFGAFLGFFVQFLIIYLSGYLFFLINSKFLVPRVLKHQGLITYLLSLLATIAFAYPFLSQLLISLPINRVFGSEIFASNPFALENAFGALAIMLVSLPIVLSLQWARQNTQIVSLEKEKTRTELDLLKQQLNPHFFFNTLNNLYGLSIQQSEKTSESILQLAELMRYTIYKGQKEFITLKEEITYINDYIQLQQIRLKKTLSLTINENIEDYNQLLPPLLLIVLIENAFKHGIEPAEEEAFLDVSITCNQQFFIFVCRNSVEQQAAKPIGGIGLDNLKKRLSLLYPNRHQLKVNSEKAIFNVELKINFE